MITRQSMIWYNRVHITIGVHTERGGIDNYFMLFHLIISNLFISDSVNIAYARYYGKIYFMLT